MSITAIFAALLGKGAVSAASKAIGGKAAAKAAAHHAHRSIGGKIAAKLVDEAKSEAKDAVVEKAKASFWGRKKKGERA